MRTTLRLVLGVVITLGVAAASALVACSTDETASAADASVDGTSGDAGGSSDALAESASSEAGADGARDADAGRLVRDANGPGEAGDECSFNRDCQTTLRCECNGACACAPGARGTGQNGIDACDSGNQCASSVCLEGPDGGYLCSDECLTPADCPPKLPRCEDITFVGRICVRQP